MGGGAKVKRLVGSPLVSVPLTPVTVPAELSDVDAQILDLL